MINVTDTAEHTTFACNGLQIRRASLMSEVGSLPVDTIVETMLYGDETWNSVECFVEAILKAKKTDLDWVH